MNIFKFIGVDVLFVMFVMFVVDFNAVGFSFAAGAFED